MPRSSAETRWMKHGSVNEFVFLGKEVIAMASGVHVTFFNFTTKEKKIESFNDQERGDGATCLAGHPIVPMFSVAERKRIPKISVFTYPAMHKVSYCALNDATNGYLSCAFVGTEYLMALSTFPNFKIIIWLWRTGEKLAEIETELEEFDQRISCSPNSPQLISQFSPNGGKVIFYQMHVCSKIISIRPIEMTPSVDKISSLSWTQDGNVFVCDIFCNVWLIILDTGERCSVLRNAAQIVSKQKPSILSYRDGVIVISHEGGVRFYRKPPDLEFVRDAWQCVWTSKMVPYPTHLILHPQRDSILLRSQHGVIYEITVQFDSISRFEIVADDGFKYKSLSPVSCLSDIFVTIDGNDRLNVLETMTGNVVARLTLKYHGKVNSVAGHPNLPVIVTCFENGGLVLIDLSQTSLPRIVTCFHLDDGKLDKAKFSDSGRVIGTLSPDVGRIFLIKCNFRAEEESVVGLLNIVREVVDFLIYEKHEEITVLVLPKGAFNACVGDSIIIYKCVFVNNNCFEEKITNIVKLLHPFGSLHYGSRRNKDFLGTPYLSKQLHRFELTSNDVTLTEAVNSIHRLRNIGMNASTRNIVTSGYDGFVIVRDGLDVQKLISQFMAHHRSEGGTKYAIVCKEIIVSLGRNGDLVATKFCHTNVKNTLEDDEIYKETTISVVTSNYDKLFTEQEKATWLENIKHAKRRKEEKEAETIRNSILFDFRKLRNQIKNMLDENEMAPDYVRLPISSFDLDNELRNDKVRTAQVERENVEKKLKNQITGQNEIVQYLRETFWESLEVHSCHLITLFGNTRVRNYPLSKVIEEIDDFQLSEQNAFDLSDFDRTEIQNHKLAKRTSNPLNVHTSEDLNNAEPTFQGHITSDEILARTARTSNMKTKKMQETLGCSDKQNVSFLSGSSAYRWIDDDSSRSSNQLEALDCVNVKQEHQRIANRERGLKMCFNDLFEEMRAVKEKEMSVTKEKIDRLRQCAAELKSMFQIESPVEEIESPKWWPSEIAENVITVRDEEVSVPMYVSPRCEDEEEDNVEEKQEKQPVQRNYEFYENALEGFMDGVLEVRWEDDIKKDVPKPECILTKEPSEYTEADLKSIKIYQKRVRELKAERVKYKLMLEEEIIQTKESLRENMKAFDDRLKAFALTRIEIHAAILQEKLMRLRVTRKHHFSLRQKQKVASFMVTEFQPISKEVRTISDEYSIIETVTSELKNRYDTLLKRDKFLETKFRTEFGNLKQPMVEHLVRHYKRRPRVGILTCTSVTYLAELGKCVVMNERSEILPRECLDFLRGLDGLDVLPASLPTQIDAVHWRTMCKLRRTKIETEMKLRSSAIELAEAESCCCFYQKLSHSIQNRFTHLKNHLELLEKSSDERSSEVKGATEVQLVLKMGQIEVPLHGHVRDFENSIIIDREELVRVNEKIRSTGKKKLAAIQRDINLRKWILESEWKHKCTIMTLDDLKNEFKAIHSVKIFKDVQDYLKLFPKVPTPEKELQTIERNAQAIENRFRRLVADEEARLTQTTQSIERWRKSNETLVREIETKKSINALHLKNSSAKAIALAKQEEFEKKKLAAIAMRTKLVRKIEENYEELLTLHARLEVLKLRTYPTLKFQSARERRRVQI